MFKVLGGDFGENFYATVQRSALGDFMALCVKHRQFGKHRIQAVEKVDETNKSSLLSAVGGAAVGTLLAGPIGLVAGALFGGAPKRSAVVFLVRLTNGKNLLCSGSSEDYQTLLAASLAPKPPEKAMDWSFLDTPEEGQIPEETSVYVCPYCEGEMEVGAEHLGTLVCCPHCQQSIQIPIE
jgi:hypothetical protein